MAINKINNILLIIITVITFIEGLLCAKYSKNLICMVSFNALNNPIRQVFLLTPFNRYKNCGSEKLSTWSKHCSWEIREPRFKHR